MNILIIEDEERSFMRLKRLLLNTIDASLRIDGPITNVADAIGALREATDETQRYDIIFADIRLEDGDVFDAFIDCTPQVPVIFTTAYNEYALEAFRSNGIAYLLKPIVPSELEEAVKKASALVADRQAPPADIPALLASLGLHQTHDYREHFLVPNNDGYTVLNVHDINHFSTENGITRAYLNNGRSMALTYPLGDIEAQLNPRKFFRANRQYIIHIDSIERIYFSFNYKLSVHLKGYPQVEILVSKEKAALLKEWADK